MKQGWKATKLAWLLSLGALSVGVPALAQEQEVVVHVRDHRFDTSEVKLPVWSRVRLVIENQGQRAEVFDTALLDRAARIAPNSTAVVHLRPLLPGRYTFRGVELASGDFPKGELVVE